MYYTIKYEKGNAFHPRGRARDCNGLYMHPEIMTVSLPPI
jgi:hypothetical protein